MPKILLLTTDQEVHVDRETELVVAALQARGAAAQVITWRDPELLSTEAEVAVIRSTWDYTSDLGGFLGVLESLAMPVLNPVPMVRWNAHKAYLAELAAAGVPIIPTSVVRQGDVAMPEVDSAQVIVKPAVSAGAEGVGLFDTGSADAATHLANLTLTRDALVQPFRPEVRTGERSLVHLAGRYSHAVRKVPADGDFRVQIHHGGANHQHQATAAEIAVAAAAVEAITGGEPLYARVDLVGTPDAPLVMELELIEPELFLPLAPGSAEAMADGILARL